MDGQYAYLSYIDGDFYVVDISDPFHPDSVAHCNTGTFSCNLQVANGYAYLPMSNGIRVADVRDPLQPVDLGFGSPVTSVNEICVVGDTAYVAQDSLLTVFDISDRTDFVPLASYHTPGTPEAVRVANGTAYLADSKSLLILRYTSTNEVELRPGQPCAFSLSQNHPNPFNSITNLSYAVDRVMHVELAVYDLLGRRVATLFSGTQTAGEYRLTWNAEDFSSGVYFARLQAGARAKIVKMILLK